MLAVDQNEAAIITPAVNPSAASRMRRLRSRNKKTAAAPRAVMLHVKSAASPACTTGLSPANASLTGSCYQPDPGGRRAA